MTIRNEDRSAGGRRLLARGELEFMVLLLFGYRDLVVKNENSWHPNKISEITRCSPGAGEPKKCGQRTRSEKEKVRK